MNDIQTSDRIDMRTRLASANLVWAVEADEKDGALAVKLEAKKFGFSYGKFKALEDVDFIAPRLQITAMIGPSGVGKSTLLRAVNRMHDSIPSARSEGELLIDNVNIYDKSINAVMLRRQVGMVFQRPNPFAKSIFENIAYGLRLHGIKSKSEVDGRVERALQQAALWKEVKDKLQQSGLSLSGGQQQRLCIARAVALEPDILLMDEPCSALDPIATAKIEDLMLELKENYTIVIVTHNMEQAARVSDYTAMMLGTEANRRTGTVIEFGKTADIFLRPKDKRTENYITGRFG